MLGILMMFLGVLQIARADGKVFRQATAAAISTPDQRALLHYSNGVERLVIETSIAGAGTNFAWVVPLPSEPKIEAVSTNFFEYLDRAFQPVIIYQKSYLWVFAGAIGLVGTLLIWAKRRRLHVLVSMLLFVAATSVLAGMLLPSLGKARSFASVAGIENVAVISRETVGLYDTAVLRSADGGALLRWLNENGFHTPNEALTTVEEYAKNGWYFAAARMHRTNSETGLMRSHPLSFTFKTEEAIYPLKLTGIENTDCTVELFVFGEKRAEIDNFKVEYCGEPYPSDLFGKFFSIGAQRHLIGSPELQKWVFPAEVATKLRATLSPKEMKEDAKLAWSDFNPQRLIVYSRPAALSRAADWTTCVLLIGGILLQLRAPKMRTTARIAFLAVVAVSLLAGGVRYGVSDVREVQIAAGNRYAKRSAAYDFEAAVEQFSLERKARSVLTFHELTNEISELIMERTHLTNVFTGAPMREEASPGNVDLRQASNSVAVVWFDFYGAEFVLGEFPVVEENE